MLVVPGTIAARRTVAVRRTTTIAVLVAVVHAMFAVARRSAMSSSGRFATLAVVMRAVRRMPGGRWAGVPHIMAIP